MSCTVAQKYLTILLDNADKNSLFVHNADQAYSKQRTNDAYTRHLHS